MSRWPERPSECARAADKEAPAGPFKRVLALAMKTRRRRPRAAGRPSAAEQPGLRRPTGAACRSCRASSTGAEVADHPRPGRLLGAAPGQPRRQGPRHATAPEGKTCARRVRGGRAGARRGDRRQRHAGHGRNLAAMLEDRYQQTDVTRHHRPQGCAARGGRGPDRARAADRRRAAAGGAQAWSSCGGRGSRRRPQASSTSARTRSTTRRPSRALSRDIIAALDMAEELGEDPDQRTRRRGGRRAETTASSRRGRPTARSRQQPAVEPRRRSDGEGEIRAGEMDAQPSSTPTMRRTITTARKTPDGEEPWRPQLPFSSLSNERFLQGLHQPVRRGDRRRGPLRQPTS